MKRRVNEITRFKDLLIMMESGKPLEESISKSRNVNDRIALKMYLIKKPEKNHTSDLSGNRK